MTKVFDAYAAYYDLLYKDKDYAGESEFVRNLLTQHGVTSGSILELGCGTGQHAQHFARMDYAVHGVDISHGMVQLANARKPSELINKLVFEVGDVRSIRIGRQFDAVISLFHVASYQITNDDLAAMFETAAAHLKPGGAFLFDCWYGPAVLTDRPAVRVKRMQGDGFDVLRIAEPVMHPNENVVDVNYTVQITKHAGNYVENIHETHQMRYLFKPELEVMLSSVGLKMQRAQEWMSGKNLNSDTWQATFLSQRQEVITVRNEERA